MSLKQPACLIIHGFTGSPFEVMPLAEHLTRRGYPVGVPTLAGHGGRPRELGKVSYQDWIASAEAVLRELLESHSRVVIIGFSMGGLIGIHLARKYPVQGLVTLSSPIYVLEPRRIILNVMEELKRKDYQRIHKYAGNVLQTPLRAILNFKTLLFKSKPLIPQITVPLLVVQGHKDDTVKPKSANYIFQRASSARKELHFLPESGHFICCDCEREQVFRLVETFIKNDRVQPGPAGN